jgi:hypothetical protein
MNNGSNAAPSGPPKSAGLDLTSRLYASSMLAPPLTASAPHVPWLKAQPDRPAPQKPLIPKILAAAMAKEAAATEAKEEKGKPHPLVRTIAQRQPLTCRFSQPFKCRDCRRRWDP